jgi:hypothetical protein
VHKVQADEPRAALLPARGCAGACPPAGAAPQARGSGAVAHPIRGHRAGTRRAQVEHARGRWPKRGAWARDPGQQMQVGKSVRGQWSGSWAACWELGRRAECLPGGATLVSKRPAASSQRGMHACMHRRVLGNPPPRASWQGRQTLQHARLEGSCGTGDYAPTPPASGGHRAARTSPHACWAEGGERGQEGKSAGCRRKQGSGRLCSAVAAVAAGPSRAAKWLGDAPVQP